MLIVTLSSRCDDLLSSYTHTHVSHFVGSLRTIFSGESFGSTPAAAAISGDLTPFEEDPGADLGGDLGGVTIPSSSLT